MQRLWITLINLKIDLVKDQLNDDVGCDDFYMKRYKEIIAGETESGSIILNLKNDYKKLIEFTRIKCWWFLNEHDGRIGN